MLIYNQRNFDLHLTQLNCAIANWATIIRIICRPTQMLLAFATGRPLILIPVAFTQLQLTNRVRERPHI
jgi:hypothetical protein